MTTEKLTDDMMQSVQSEQTGANNDAPMEQSSEKPVKQKKVKQKRKYKTSTTLYILLTIVGVFLIGLGGAISVFELSEYKMANYRALPADPDLPPIEMQTTTLEATYEKGAQFKLDAADWYISGNYDIQYDNNLKDKVRIEVNAPKGMYDVYLITQGENHYYLDFREDVFEIFYHALTMAKDGYILESPPRVSMTLTMSEAQAKNFKLNEERYKNQEARQSYNEQLNEARTEYTEQLNQARTEYTEQLNQTRNEYNEQLNNQRNEYTAQIEQMQEEYNNKIQEMQTQHDTRMEETRKEYERRIAELEMQLNDARNALN